MGKNMGRQPRTVGEMEFFILGSGVLTKAALVVVPGGKESDSTVKPVTYMKENFVTDVGRVRELCITAMEVFIEDIGITIKNMDSEK